MKMFLIILMVVNYSVFAENRILVIPKPGTDPVSQSASVVQLKSPGPATLFSPKIVGGIMARRGEFPGFVHLFRLGKLKVNKFNYDWYSYESGNMPVWQYQMVVL